MSEGEHSVLAPSAAERWIACPASIRMERQVDKPPSSSYADEGSAAHALCEIKARDALIKHLDIRQHEAALKKWRKEWAHAIVDESEMHEHAAAYVELLRGKLAEHPNSQLLLEQRVPTGVPSCWGTSDAVIVSPVHVEIVDLKYGKGIQVEAEGNAQLRLYGIGALEAFGDLLGEAEFVTCTVFQPRLNHTVSETISAVELRAWRDSLIPIAESALGHDAPFGPSDTACRWCPASGQCKAQLTYATTMDFGVDPDALEDADLADALERIPQIEAWCAAVKVYALDRVYSKGKPIPGYKVVMSSGNRFVSDEEGALKALQALGYTDEEIVNRKIKGIGDLEKLLKKDFNVALSSFVKKGDGKPSLVTEGDSRPSITPDAEAAKVFDDNQG